MPDQSLLNAILDSPTYYYTKGANIAVKVLVGIMVGLILLMVGGALFWLWWRNDRLHPKLNDNDGNAFNNDGGHGTTPSSKKKVSPAKTATEILSSSAISPEPTSHTGGGQVPPPGSFYSGTTAAYGETPGGGQVPPPGSFYSGTTAAYGETPSTPMPSIGRHEPVHGETQTGSTFYDPTTTPEYMQMQMQMPVPHPTPSTGFPRDQQAQGVYPQQHSQVYPPSYPPGYSQDYYRGQ
ncbi:15471_t:CDS:2 [Acaulospora colombiana]|uniref:15471_t:CDS:1 n=1 Tax=Acaulospora colombiana TaxID=27376 RepID=A0ACA9KEJ4_9GLOM|nr:15471_t:CDS:2 [Acaulospora colombiana]